MSNLNKIVRTSQNTMDEILNGTHSTHTYDNNNMYQVELDDPLIFGNSGSGLTVDLDTNVVKADVRDVQSKGSSVVVNGIAYLPSGIIVQDTEPTDAQVGDVWIDTSVPGDSPQDVSTAIATHNSDTTAHTYLLGEVSRLDGRCDNLQNVGRYLALWDCTTGKPTTNPTTLPYTYKSGDYYRIGTCAEGSETVMYRHTIHLDCEQYTTNYSYVDFVFDSADSTAYTANTLYTAMNNAGVNDVNNRITGTGRAYNDRYDATGVYAKIQYSRKNFFITFLSGTSILWYGGYITDCSVTDVVTSLTNYRPNGSTYNNVASTTIETDPVVVGDVYFYDGTSWSLQVNHSLDVYTKTQSDALFSTKATTYTKTEVDTTFTSYRTSADQDVIDAGKAAAVHNHDDRYYTESEVDTALSGKAAAVHTHDDRYYTEAETNSLIEDKANKSDIVDNLTTNDATKMLSAKQGKALNEDKSDKLPRYKDITSYFTDGTLWNRISGNGYSHPYYDICVGDYLDMGATVTCPDSYSGTTGSRYVTVASLGGLQGNGDNIDMLFPHLVMIPGQGAGGSFHFGRHAMNDSHITTGGYVGSKMHTDVLGPVVSSGSATGTINQQLYNIFGAHLKTTRELLTNSINASGYNRFGTNSGCSNNWGWVSCQACLMSEVEVYGSAIWSSSGYDTGTAKRQFELFAMDEKTINNRSSYYWLKDVVSASDFAFVDSFGSADFSSAGYANLYVRPRFVIA